MTVEIRDVNADYWSASGWATTWSGDGRSYFVSDPREGLFLEQVERGAFRDATGGREHVELRLEHNPSGPVFASTKARSLHFTNERDGLMMAAALSKADDATKTAVEEVRAGKLTGLSVGMRVTDDVWDKAPDGRTALRSIRRASLIETSLVQRPANPRALITAVRHAPDHETRSVGHIEYRHVPLLALRETMTDGSDGNYADDDEEACPRCDGEGWVGDASTTCPDCGGTGVVNDEPDADDTGGRSAKYSAAELASMLVNGHALPNAAGRPSFPIEDADDLRRAIRAVGRSGRSPERVRLHIMRNAKRLGLSAMLPDTWSADGSLRRSVADLKLRASAARFDALAAEIAELSRKSPQTFADLVNEARALGVKV